MDRIPFAGTRYARIFETADGAGRYDAHHAARARRLGRWFARALTDRGFTKGAILDAGCAAGHTAIAVATALPDAEIVGIDSCGPLLERANANAKREGLTDRVTFLSRDVASTGLDDGAFQAVVSNDTLHVVADPVPMLNECERVLAPDGVLLVRNIRRCWLGWLDSIFRTSYTPAEVESFVERSTLRPCRVRSGFATLLVEASPRE
jgi:2-polyprenyl-3-methyl-5-hydroxy-6-metoxy-1,4-benzoquinol methylase